MRSRGLTWLIVLVAYIGTMVWTVWISLTNSKLLPVNTFAGFDQYVRLAQDSRWLPSIGNMAIFVADHGIIDRCFLRFVDVLNPLLMRLDRTDAEGDELDSPAIKFLFQASGLPQLCCADRGEVFGVGKENPPGIA